MKVYIIGLISVFLAAGSAPATVIEVPGDYPTIQQGIDASYNGDTVLVKPEVYVENINFNGKNIVVGSRFLITGDTTYICDTIIDGDSAGSVVSIVDGEDSTTAIIGFTIKNGYNSTGGGIRCENSNPLISNNLIKDNISYIHDLAGGGGIYCLYSNARIFNNKIMGNRACYGGGIFCDYSNAIIKFNFIASNRAFP